MHSMSVDDEPERVGKGEMVDKVVGGKEKPSVGLKGPEIDYGMVDHAWDMDDEDGGAGALLCFLMDLQATAQESFGGGPEFDPKLYVDLPLKCSLDVTEAAFAALPPGRAPGSVEPGSLCRALPHLLLMIVKEFAGISVGFHFFLALSSVFHLGYYVTSRGGVILCNVMAARVCARARVRVFVCLCVRCAVCVKVERFEWEGF